MDFLLHDVIINPAKAVKAVILFLQEHTILRDAKKVGADFRNDLCNGMIQFYPDYFEDERKFCRALFIKKKFLRSMVMVR